MSWIASAVSSLGGAGTAILGGSIIGGIGSILGGKEQAKGQEEAARTQQHMFDTIVGQEQPFLQAGYGATQTISDLLGTSGKKLGSIDPGTGLPIGYLTQQFQPTQQQLNNYPGYQFALKTGGQAVRNADTPGSGALSGAALKDLMGFDIGTANQYYGQYFNQFQQQQNNIFDRLSNIATMGQNAAGNLGSVGSQLGTGIAQAQAAAAGSQAGGIVGATNALGGGLSTAALMNYFGSSGGGGGQAAAFNQANPVMDAPAMPTFNKITGGG